MTKYIVLRKIPAPSPRLDDVLNAAVREAKLDELEREVNVVIEAPHLRAPVQNSDRIGDDLYRAKVTLNYLRELSCREDIEMVYEKSAWLNE